MADGSAQSERACADAGTAGLALWRARVLRAGVWVAAGLCTAGAAWFVWQGGHGGDGGERLMRAGLIALIATPVVRVTAALFGFAGRRERVMAACCAVVLAVLGLGLAGVVK